MSDSQQTERPRRKSSPRRRTTTLLLVGLAGAVAAAASVAIYHWYFGQDRLPELTAQRLADAQKTWQREGPGSYDIEVQVHGRQPAVYRVEVRDGEVLKATHNGNPLRSPRTMGTWSVPGMFGTIRIDVDNVERVAAGNADRGTPRLRLAAEIHPRFGYPEKYRRVQWGSRQEVSWEVRQFRVVD